MKYLIRLKNGSMIETDVAGRIVYDGTRGMRFAPSDSWRIVGFSTRHNAYRIVTLAEAAAGEPIGQGWVHDVDHGTRRMWAMPRYHRAVRVEVTP